jgi:putative heat shock sigma factor
MGDAHTNTVSAHTSLSSCRANYGSPAHGREQTPFIPRLLPGPSSNICFTFSDIGGEKMYTKNNGSGENNVIQNRFTAYLLTAIHRKKAAYLGACSRRREMELPTDPDDIVSVLDAMVNSAVDAPLPFPLFKNDALEEALQKLSQRDRYIFLAHALYQRDFGDLASELGLTYQGAATAYHRARKKIKDTFGRNVK